MPVLAVADENWPQWRGPDQNGVAQARDLPASWSETENIVWKTELPCWSGSSPIIWADTVYVTSPSKPEGGNDGRAVGDKLLLLAVAKDDGHILWERELDAGNRVLNKQNMSSPTPVTDGAHIWAMTGTGAVACLTMDGEIVWKRNIQDMYGKFGQQFGYGSSPLLYDGKLVVQVLHGFFTDEPSYVMALDAASGEMAWRVERPTEAQLESPDSYGTPALFQHEGKAEIVVSGGDYVTGHDPATGEELWRAGGLNPKNIDRNRIIVSPVAVDGMVYVGSRQDPFLVFHPGGKLAWEHNRYAPDVPTPVVDGKRVYLFDDKGVVHCLDAKTGEVVWGPERTARGVVSASPIMADGKVYVTNEEGVTSVVAARDKFKLLATNTLPSKGRTLSTFAVSGNRLYLRTPTHLYCIGKN